MNEQMELPTVEPEAPAHEPSAKEAEVIEALQTIYDPEIPVNIYELGLIYGIDVTPEGNVAIQMTLTAPACPVAGTLPGEVEARVRDVEGVRDVKVELVWDPPWHHTMISAEGRKKLGLDQA